MNFILAMALWVCGTKTDPPVKYYSATGSTRSEAVQAATNACAAQNPMENCNLVGCKNIQPGERK